MNKNPKSPTRILITSGPTVEPLDPVRFISNRSTGVMGKAIAEESLARGFFTRLITGPVCGALPDKAETIKVFTAAEMKEKVMKHIDDCDCLVMAAAVCDFRPVEQQKEKIKKRDRLTLELVKNPDILADIGKRAGLIKVGFSLETGKDWLENSKEKLETKCLDIIVVNVKKENRDPFGGGDKDFAIIDRHGRSAELSKISKKECAGAIFDRIEDLL